MDTNDFYGLAGQSYSGSGIDKARTRVNNINAHRAGQSVGIAAPTVQPSQAVTVMNEIISSNQAEKLEKKSQLREAKYEAAMNGGTAGLGGQNISVPTGSANIPAGNMQKVIQDIDNQKLKYSQKRGKGCTDCSAFTQKLYKDTTGKNIGGWTEEQWKNGKTVNPNQAQNGNLVFFKSNDPKYKNRNVTHVGKYNGDGTFTHFSTNGLKTSKLDGYSLPIVGFKSY